MEFKDLVIRGEMLTTMQLIHRLMIKPFIVGVLYGIGHFSAYLILCNLSVRNLVETYKIEKAKEPFKN